MTPLALTLVLLAVPGCLYWLALVAVGLATRRHVPRLLDLPAPERERWPRVSLVIPACDEADGLEAAVATRLAEDYPDLEIVLVDDRSTDGTGAVVDRLAAADPRVRAVHVERLPEGWLGKNHAQHVGAAAATGEWLLFTDADVHQRPGTLRRVLGHALEHGHDFLAVFPEVWSNGFLLDALLGVFGRGFALGTRLWAVNDPRSDAAAGVGAFNLVRRAAFDATPGFPWLRLDVADDLALALMMKRHGARCGLLSGVGFVGLDWYRGVGDLARGFEKNAFSVVGRFSLARLVGLAALLWLLECGPFLALVPGGPGWLAVLGLLALGAVLLNAAGFALWSRRPFLATACAPLGATLLAAVFVRAGWLGRRRGGVLWRGTLYPTALLRGAMRCTF